MRKIISDRKCPCCHEMITFDEYSRYMQSIAGDGDLKLFTCPDCHNIVFSIKDRSIWSDGIHFVMILFSLLLLYILDYHEWISYIVFISFVFVWLSAEKILPFLYVKFRCIPKENAQSMIKESHVSGVMVFLSFLLFVLVLFGLFQVLVQETKTQNILSAEGVTHV